MTGRVARIWRHPIKAHGREALDRVHLTKGNTMPWDRRWAVTHAQTKADGSDWAHCANFTRGAKVPQLQAIRSTVEESSGTVTLTHPDRPDLTFDPDTEKQLFLDWVGPLLPVDHPPSTDIVSVPGRGMTDTDFPSVSLINLASHRAVSDRLGQDLSVLRWRGNFILDGLGPWQEFEWLGKRLRLGGAELLVRERIKRCKATTANPETGIRDVDTLATLRQGWDHQDFGIYAEVVASGDVAVDDDLELLQ